MHTKLSIRMETLVTPEVQDLKSTSTSVEDFETYKVTQREKKKIESKYSDKLVINTDLTRQLVSFQANKQQPVYRWFKYKEAFSADLIKYILKSLNLDTGRLLDPFAGAGTALFAGADAGLDTVGIELLPIGYEIIKMRHRISNGSSGIVQNALNRWIEEKPWLDERELLNINHLNITKGAYPPQEEQLLAKYLKRCTREESDLVRDTLQFAALSILESISYTRKDGQYLRWDHRSPRNRIKSKFNKGRIIPFNEAITDKMTQMLHDISTPKDLFSTLTQKQHKSGRIKVINGSVLDVLPGLDSNSFDGLITSPPYCNRYDYTRTYALELALLGVGEQGIRDLRQEMLSCTVENRAKDLEKFSSTSTEAIEAFEAHSTMQSIVTYLEDCKENKKLNNTGISRMVKNYFLEMCFVIFETAPSAEKRSTNGYG